jgi:hypothetical protein
MLSEKSSIVSFQPSRRNESWAAAYAEDDALSAYKAVGHP